MAALGSDSRNDSGFRPMARDIADLTYWRPEPQVRSLTMPDKKPNILVIWGDDIGMWNVGAYTHGMMGRTPNIDSIAKDGVDWTATVAIGPVTEASLLPVLAGSTPRSGSMNCGSIDR